MRKSVARKLEAYLKKQELGQGEFGELVGVTQGMVWQWLNQVRDVSAEKVIAIEEATKGAVSRHEIRPDIYPKAS